MLGRSALAVFTLVSSGCIGPELDVGDDQSGIVNGQLSPGDDAIVALTINGQQFCTGTLVTPTVVVTAAHCLPPNLEGVPMDAIEIFFGADINQGGSTIPVLSGLAHTAWNENVVPNDIGAVSLSQPAPVAPIPMLNDDLDALQPVGDTVRMVGYGITAFEGTGNGTKRSGEMTIDAMDSSTIYLGPGPSLTCNGDSGGPLLMNVDGVEVLAGIHSRSDCETQSLNERVDVHTTGFIRDFLRDYNGGAECIADGLCADGCASPDPDCPCIGDGMCSDICPELDSDPDCPDGCGLADGVCPEGCPSADPDCEIVEEEESVEGGCAAGGTGQLPGLLLLVALLAATRRRRCQ